GNARSNRLVDARANIMFSFTERTKEGKTFYRMVDLVLSRTTNASLSRSWQLLHPIDDKSPLFGSTQQSLIDMEAELYVTVTGIDDIWMQTVHAGNRYMAQEIVVGSRLVDVLSEEGSALVLDLRKFHDIETDETWK